MTTRRTGITAEGGRAVTLLGPALEVGQPAPDFRCCRYDLDAGVEVVTLADTSAAVRLFSVVPSLDTPVCSIQTVRFAFEVGALGDDVAAYAVSVDTPYAQGRFCGSEAIPTMKTLSDYRPERSFGHAWGLLVEESGELARTVVVVDEVGTVRHVEIVADADLHPDYDAALAALRELLGR